jgi:hypothetical protein
MCSAARGRLSPPCRDNGRAGKGQLATIGRSRAILETGRVRLAGFLAWWAWLVVHIYYLSGFQNRLVVLIQWAWSFVTFGRGARLIVEKQWRSYADEPTTDAVSAEPREPSRRSLAAAPRRGELDAPLARMSDDSAP